MRNGQNPNIDDDTRARARRFVADAGPRANAAEDDATKRIAKPKAPIVTKKMLADSGFDNLRDYLNDRRKLARRGTSVAEAKKQLNLGERPSAKSVADAKAQLGLDEPAQTPRYMTNKPGTNVNYENTDTSDMSMKRGGKVKGYAKGGMTASKRADGCAVRGKTRA